MVALLKALKEQNYQNREQQDALTELSKRLYIAILSIFDKNSATVKYRTLRIELAYLYILFWMDIKDKRTCTLVDCYARR